eukprot:4246717-Pyramimonas_sp.AAC.1
MEEGADLRGARRHLISLRKKGGHEMAGAMEAVMAGASWTRHRMSTLSSCRLDATACQRCDCGQEETDLHRNWQRPCNVHFS